MKKNYILFVALFISQIKIFAQSGDGANLITADQLKDYRSFVASDLMEGRNTPSRGLDITAQFIVTNLSRWGVKPAGDSGTYLQKYPVWKNTVVPKKTYVEVNGVQYHFGDCLIGWNSGNGKATGKAVYVQHGWCLKSKEIDPYLNVDVKDKIVIFQRGWPIPGIMASDLKGEDGMDYESVWLAAKKRGAKALIAVPAFDMLQYWRQNEEYYIKTGLLSDSDPDSNIKLPVLTVSLRALGAVFSGEKHSAVDVITGGWQGKYFESFELTKDSITVSVETIPEKIHSQNIVGIIEGKTRQKEYVAVGAHYDHAGIDEPVKGDSIYNGADDNGSGTVSVLSIAEALAKGQKPRRSIVLVWFSGEEQSFWGSSYFCKHPPVSLDQITAYINLDMIGRCRKDDDTTGVHEDLVMMNEINVLGPKIQDNGLDLVLDHVNRSYDKLILNYKKDREDDPDRFFYRSDQYYFAMKDIPVLSFDDGKHEDYHTPTDSADKIDYGKMEKVTRLIYRTVMEIGNMSKKPVVQKKGIIRDTDN